MISNLRFINNNDGIITDTKTDLIWQKDTERIMTYDEAINHCNDLSLAGHNNWRLPTIKELQSIVDYKLFNPATIFPNMILSAYWSLPTGAHDSLYAQSVRRRRYGDVYDGGRSHGGRSHGCYVRAVRGGNL